nr:hypothetical protein [Methylomonas koyamae]
MPRLLDPLVKALFGHAAQQVFQPVQFLRQPFLGPRSARPLRIGRRQPQIVFEEGRQLFQYGAFGRGQFVTIATGQAIEIRQQAQHELMDLLQRRPGRRLAQPRLGVIDQFFQVPGLAPQAPGQFRNRRAPPRQYYPQYQVKPERQAETEEDGAEENEADGADADTGITRQTAADAAQPAPVQVPLEFAGCGRFREKAHVALETNGVPLSMAETRRDCNLPQEPRPMARRRRKARS